MLQSLLINRFDPTGKSLPRPSHTPVQPPSQKYSAFPKPQITCIYPPSRPSEGRIMIVANVGYGMRWTRQRWARHAIAGRGHPLSEPRERSAARGRTALQRLHRDFGWSHMAGRSVRRRLLRTAKPCRSGTRCWCQAGGGLSGPTGLR